MKLQLTPQERANLRKNKVRKSEILDYAIDELAILLGVSEQRAKEVHALSEFQTIPSIGVEFAKDLIFLRLYSIADLQNKNGAQLIDEYERKKGCTTDPCVEDQFRLAVNFAQTGDHSKRWWHFTKERKAYREKCGYPADRPTIKWTEILLQKA